MAKSYVPAANALIKIDVRQYNIANESQQYKKRDSPIGLKDKNPQTIKRAKNKDGSSLNMRNPKEFLNIINFSVWEEIDEVPGF